MDTAHLNWINRLFGKQLDKKVFYTSVVLALPFLLLGGFSPDLLGRISDTVLAYLTTSWSWLYLTSVSAFVLVCLVLALSPFGKVKLGRDDEKSRILAAQLVCHAFLRRHGHRPGLLVHCRTHVPFYGPPCGPRVDTGIGPDGL